jgi:putative ABC transport system substrate-binding protein
VTGGIGAAAVAEHFKDLVGRVMKGREFIVAIAGATVWPLAAYSQQRAAAMPIIGYFGIESLGPFADRIAAFRDGLRTAGFVEGRNSHM